MKIRSDYVSNSSSSSFMVVGTSFTYEDLLEMAKKHKVKSPYHEGEDEEEPNYDDWDSYELSEALEALFPDLRFNRGIEEFYDEYCVGMDYDDMEPSETRKDFEERIKEQLKKLSGKDCEVGCLVDGGRDG